MRATVAAALVLRHACAFRGGSSAPRLGRLCASAQSRPELCVFDLDDCVWHPEMFTLTSMPGRAILGDLNGRGQGVVGVESGSEVIRLFPGALQALQECADGEHDPMRLAVASSADTPFAARIAHAALAMLEVLPGVTVRDTLARGWPADFQGNVQIGRSSPLSSDKSATHFPILKEGTGISYVGMLFFDDSNWSDHCTIVAKNCPGVVTQRTPSGMQASEWRGALEKYARTVCAPP
mmetsp:Transcript_32668/g.113072  ORF Transcript_32668/g.113072 Transcript_32668/m.113072 type:complete len:237 (+) Transcript_32668:122-832(+)